MITVLLVGVLLGHCEVPQLSFCVRSPIQYPKHSRLRIRVPLHEAEHEDQRLHDSKPTSARKVNSFIEISVKFIVNLLKSTISLKTFRWLLWSNIKKPYFFVRNDTTFDNQTGVLHHILPTEEHLYILHNFHFYNTAQILVSTFHLLRQQWKERWHHWIHRMNFLFQWLDCIEDLNFQVFTYEWKWSWILNKLVLDLEPLFLKLIFKTDHCLKWLYIYSGHLENLFEEETGITL